MTIGRVVWRGTLASAALAVVVVGLVWLNRVSSSVMELGGSCGSGGPYEIAQPCPGGAWMTPVGIFVGLAGLAVYAFTRPAGSPALAIFAWPALFGSLGIQFLRAASEETDAWGFWLCGVLFLGMAIAPLALVVSSHRRALVEFLVGDGHAAPERADRDDRRDPTVPRPAPKVPVTFVAPGAEVDGDGDLAESLERLALLHRTGELTDAEFAEAKQQVLGGG
ncbi:MAG TPA: SHOCT domain-containing protein [Acidimicrobiales bacterium]|nr:SHOCT domain-containing protein [Acidimicrobiales bacterium]